MAPVHRKGGSERVNIAALAREKTAGIPPVHSKGGFKRVNIAALGIGGGGSKRVNIAALGTGGPPVHSKGGSIRVDIGALLREKRRSNVMESGKLVLPEGFPAQANIPFYHKSNTSALKKGSLLSQGGTSSMFPKKSTNPICISIDTDSSIDQVNSAVVKVLTQLVGQLSNIEGQIERNTIAIEKMSRLFEIFLSQADARAARESINLNKTLVHAESDHGSPLIRKRGRRVIQPKGVMRQLVDQLLSATDEEDFTELLGEVKVALEDAGDHNAAESIIPTSFKTKTARNRWAALLCLYC